MYVTLKSSIKESLAITMNYTLGSIFFFANELASGFLEVPKQKQSVFKGRENMLLDQILILVILRRRIKRIK